MQRHVPAKAAHFCHRAHRVVQRAEWIAHCAYLTMVSIGSHDYHVAAAAMLGTTVIGALLHTVIALAGEAE